MIKNHTSIPFVAMSVALFALIALPLRGQESRPATTEPTTAAVDPASREAARKLLDRAIASQLGGLERGTIRSFQGQFNFQLFREKDELVGDYAQAWCFDDKDRFHFRRKLTTDYSKKVVTLVCNGRDEIFGIDARGRTIAKNRAEDEQDRDNIRIEKRSARRLYELFFLNELEVEETTLELISAKETLEITIGANSPFKGEVKVIRLRSKDGKRIRLWLADSEKSCDIVQAEVFDTRDPRMGTAEDGSEKPVAETFQMLLHWKVTLPGSDKTIRFPLRMRYLVDAKPVIEITCDDPGDIRLNSIDAKLRRKLFEPEE